MEQVLSEEQLLGNFSDCALISKLMSHPLGFDTRLIIDTEEASKFGINIWKIGRGFKCKSNEIKIIRYKYLDRKFLKIIIR